MKKILKSTLLCFGLLVLGSCEHDPDPIVQANSFALRSAQAGTSLVLQPQQDADAAVVLDWDRSVNGDFASISTYRVVISESGSNNADAVVANNGDQVPNLVNYTLTVKELNALINQLPGYACGTPMNVDIRVQSTLGEGAANPFVQYSNIINLTVTPYSTDVPTLAFATSASTAANSQKLESSGVLMTDFEGFVYLEAGNYQFFQPNACGDYGTPSKYGVSSSNSGTLTPDDTGTYAVTTAGHFYIKANTDAGVLSYSIAPFTGAQFGIFGRATKIVGFASTTPMTYDPATKKWSITIELINGKTFGFKTNNSASPAAVFTGSGVAPVNALGSLSVATGAIVNDGTIAAPGTFTGDKTKYDVVVDLSVPKHYTYMLTPNPN